MNITQKIIVKIKIRQLKKLIRLQRKGQGKKRSDAYHKLNEMSRFYCIACAFYHDEQDRCYFSPYELRSWSAFRCPSFASLENKEAVEKKMQNISIVKQQELEREILLNSTNTLKSRENDPIALYALYEISQTIDHTYLLESAKKGYALADKTITSKYHYNAPDPNAKKSLLGQRGGFVPSEIKEYLISRKECTGVASNTAVGWVQNDCGETGTITDFDLADRSLIENDIPKAIERYVSFLDDSIKNNKRYEIEIAYRRLEHLYSEIDLSLIEEDLRIKWEKAIKDGFCYIRDEIYFERDSKTLGLYNYNIKPYNNRSNCQKGYYKKH